VKVLHPVEDAGLLGTRYCTGGFVYQIEDHRYGPLLAGPTYPDSYNLFDGQGIPDAFQPHLPLGDGGVLGIGIGRIDTGRDVILERCVWEIDTELRRLGFRTTQTAGGYAFDLERTISLEGRTLRSTTRLVNHGKQHVPFQWFPHPFFPHYETGECCKFDAKVVVPENPGFEVTRSGYVRMKGHPWVTQSHFQLVSHPPVPVRVLQKHPHLGVVAAACDYVSARLPIWGNPRTFSFEPYYERVITPGDEAQWSVTYDF
jgi:hypothetical protein